MILNSTHSIKNIDGTDHKKDVIDLKKEIVNALALKMYAQGVSEGDVTTFFSGHFVSRDLTQPEKFIWVLTPIGSEHTNMFSGMVVNIDMSNITSVIDFDHFFLAAKVKKEKKDLQYWLNAKRHHSDKVQLDVPNLLTYERRLYSYAQHKLKQVIIAKRVLVAKLFSKDCGDEKLRKSLIGALCENKEASIALSKIITSLKNKDEEYKAVIGKKSIYWKHPLFDIPLQFCYILEKKAQSNGSTKIVLSKVKFETVGSFVLENDYFHPREVKKDSGCIISFLKLDRPYLSINQQTNALNIEEIDFIELGV